MILYVVWTNYGSVWLGNPDLDFQNLNPDFSWTAVFFFLIMRARARLLFLRTVFQILFRISQSNGKNENPKTDISALKSVFRFRIRVLSMGDWHCLILNNIVVTLINHWLMFLATVNNRRWRWSRVSLSTYQNKTSKLMWNNGIDIKCCR